MHLISPYLSEKALKMKKTTSRKGVKAGRSGGAKHEAAVASARGSFGVKHVLYNGELTQRDHSYMRLCTKRSAARLRGHSVAQILKMIEEPLD